MSKIRLKGKKLHDLYNLVYDRDGGKCFICGKYIERGTPPHHIKYRSQGGEDVMENLVMLCNECHRKVHDGKIKLKGGRI